MVQELQFVPRLAISFYMICYKKNFCLLRKYISVELKAAFGKIIKLLLAHLTAVLT